MSKAIVTGGAGFIGSHIVDHLVRDGLTVEVIDDLSSGSESNLKQSGAKLHKLDIRDRAAQDLVRKFDPELIVHAAAQMSVRNSVDDPVNDADINILGMLNLIDAWRDAKNKHFIFLSSGGTVYGDQQVYPAGEDHTTLPTCPYGMSKLCSELYLGLWQRIYGLKWTALRLANVYGPRQNPHGEAGVMAIFCERLLRGEQVTINGSGEQTRDFVYVSDVAEAVTKSYAKRAYGAFNIGTGKELSVNQLYAQLIKALKIDRKALYGPAKAGEQLRSSIAPGLALKSFDWKPTFEIEKGFEITADWYRAGAK